MRCNEATPEASLLSLLRRVECTLNYVDDFCEHLVYDREKVHWSTVLDVSLCYLSFE